MTRRPRGAGRSGRPARSPRTSRTSRATRRRTGLGVASALLLGGVIAVPAANASNTGSTGSTGSASENESEAGHARHCTLNAATGKERCFSSFTHAIANASDGRIEDAPASARTAAKDRAFQTRTRQLSADKAALADGDVISGTFFTDKAYGGDSLTVANSAPCEKDGWVNFQFDMSDGWKNRITSVQPWAGCSLWLYPQPGLGGDRDGPFDENTPDIGATMNDRTQSVGFS
jgi:hypothetical protein